MKIKKQYIALGILQICFSCFLAYQIFQDCQTYTYGKLVNVEIKSIGVGRSQVVQIKCQNKDYSFLGKSGLTNDMIGSMYQVYHYKEHFIRTDAVYGFWWNILFVIFLFMVGLYFLLVPYDL